MCSAIVAPLFATKKQAIGHLNNVMKTQSLETAGLDKDQVCVRETFQNQILLHVSNHSYNSHCL